VARLTPDGRDLEILADETELVRLGADVTATGAIGPVRMTRAVATIAQQRARAEALGATTVLGLATQGVRAAANGAKLLTRAPLLTPGALALSVTLEWLGAASMIVSRRGIREGAILAYLRRGDGWLRAAEEGEL
jgi:exopolyphosphatase/pppGpp-phosphohydrolase